MVEVVIRPLRDVLIQCDAAVPWVATNVGSRLRRQCAQPREIARAFRSPFVKQALDISSRLGRLGCPLIVKPSSSARRCSRGGLMSRSTTSRWARTRRSDHASPLTCLSLVPFACEMVTSVVSIAGVLSSTRRARSNGCGPGTFFTVQPGQHRVSPLCIRLGRRRSGRRVGSSQSAERMLTQPIGCNESHISKKVGAVRISPDGELWALSRTISVSSRSSSARKAC